MAGQVCRFVYVSESTTGISGTDLNESVNVYPNPNTGSFVVNVGGLQGLKIEIFNLMGEVIATPDNSRDGIYEVDLSGQAAGMYYVRIQSENQVVTKKVTVNK